MKIIILISMLFWYLVLSIHNVVLLQRISKAKEFIEKNIELNNSFLSDVEKQQMYIRDLIINENCVLNCLKKMLEEME